MITTPPESAQLAADALVEGGIRAIWNFAPIHLQVSPTVLLQNEDLYRSLASLSFRLERMLAAERESSFANVPAGPEPKADPPSCEPEPAREDSYAKESRRN
jgi:hypothetical protein